MERIIYEELSAEIQKLEIELEKVNEKKSLLIAKINGLYLVRDEDDKSEQIKMYNSFLNKTLFRKHPGYKHYKSAKHWNK